MRTRVMNDDRQTKFQSSSSGVSWGKGTAEITRDIRDNTVMYDVCTPDFKERSARGEVINSPMSSLKHIDHLAPGHLYGGDCWGAEVYGDRYKGKYRRYSTRLALQAVNRTSSNYLARSLDPPSVAYNRFEDDDYGYAVNLAYANATEAKVAAISFAAEMSQTTSMLASTVKKAFKLLRLMRKARFRELKGLITPKAAKNQYLEIRYGFRPLIYDIKGIAEMIDKGTRKTPRQTYRGFHARESHTTADKFTASTLYTTTERFNGGSKVTASYEKDTSEIVAYRSGILAEVYVSKVTSLMSQLGLDRPIEAIWDLTPYSFIVDWFLDIGAVIAAWTPNPGITSLAEWITVTHTSSATLKMTHVSDLQVQDGIWMKSPITATLLPVEVSSEVRVWRDVSPSRTLLPSWKVNLDFLKETDLVLIADNIRESMQRHDWGPKHRR